MLTKIKRTIKSYAMLERGERVLCALSGGVDSSVLLSALAELREELNIEVCAAHLNHMLRGKDADNDEEFCRKLCERLQVRFVSERIDVKKLSEESGESFELSARNIRYDFLKRTKESLGASKIATAHNANDNLETVIFNLARGTGMSGICGIPPVRGDVIRPIIEVTRNEIEHYASEKGISFCTDKTNEDIEYSRNRIRHNIIPQMQILNQAAVKNALRTSSVLRKEAEFLENAAKSFAKDVALSENECGVRKLLRLPDAMFGRVCEIFARNAKRDNSYSLEYCHIKSIKDVCEGKSPSGEVTLAGGMVARRKYERLVFEEKKGPEMYSSLILSEGENIWGKYRLTLKKAQKDAKIHNSLNTFFLPYGTIQSGLVVRARIEGDEIKLPKRPTKSIKKLFIEAKIPKCGREEIPIIASGEKVLAVYGFGQAEGLLSSGDDNIFIIEINEVVEK